VSNGLSSRRGAEAVQLGMIGCGRIAQAAHLPAIAKTDAVELVAVCDPSEVLAKGVGSRYGVPSFLNIEELLEQSIDAVVVAIPDRFHAPVGAAALRAGKHVLMEKPLASSTREAEELMRLAADHDLRLQTAAMKRHDPGIAFAHAHMADLGEVISYASVYRVPAMRAAIEQTLFPARMVVDDAVRERESALKSQASRAPYLLATHGAHVFDTLTYFVGPPRWLSVHEAELNGDFTWHGVLGLRSGGLGSFEITVDVHADWAEGFEVFGTDGHIKASTYQPFWNRASDVEVYLERTATSVRPHAGDTNAFKLQVEHFADAIRIGSGENPSPDDGVTVVRLIEAAKASAAGGGARVDL
jgi:predicted dehydrogenase